MSGFGIGEGLKHKAEHLEHHVAAIGGANTSVICTRTGWFRIIA